MMFILIEVDGGSQLWHRLAELKWTLNFSRRYLVDRRVQRETPNSLTKSNKLTNWTQIHAKRCALFSLPRTMEVYNKSIADTMSREDFPIFIRFWLSDSTDFDSPSSYVDSFDVLCFILRNYAILWSCLIRWDFRLIANLFHE